VARGASCSFLFGFLVQILARAFPRATSADQRSFKDFCTTVCCNQSIPVSDDDGEDRTDDEDTDGVSEESSRRRHESAAVADDDDDDDVKGLKAQYHYKTDS
jgi:hypothetical protein